MKDALPANARADLSLALLVSHIPAAAALLTRRPPRHPRCARALATCLALGLLVGAVGALADVVVPSDRVVVGVHIRAAPTSASQSLGLLRPGDELEHLGSVPSWHRVQLADQRTGFVTSAWSMVIHGAPAPLPAPDTGGPATTGEPTPEVGVEEADPAVTTVDSVRTDVVIASERVTGGVNIRVQATTQSSTVGLLAPGEELPYLGSVPRWHEVDLGDGETGFVSKAWTHVVPGGVGGPFTVDLVDVGTGLAVLVRAEDFFLVYDGGSQDDRRTGPNNRLLAFLRHSQPNLSTINHLVLSHPHRDHVELLADLFSSYSVQHVWDSGRVEEICGYRALIAAVVDEPSVYHSARLNFTTETVSFDPLRCTSLPHEVELMHASRIDQDPVPLGQGASMTFLHADGSSDGSPNENSIVVRLDLGEHRVLLMGDAEAGPRADPEVPPREHSVEGTLLRCCSEALRADVLVAGHHGSKTSSRRTFLDAVGASIFVVSSGPFPYGEDVVLPDQEVIDELEGRGQVFRTDFDEPGCRLATSKIGSDADGRVGGCDNVRITLEGGAPPGAVYFRPAD